MLVIPPAPLIKGGADRWGDLTIFNTYLLIWILGLFWFYITPRQTMFYLDSALPEIARKLPQLGWVKGITTNLTLPWDILVAIAQHF